MATVHIKEIGEWLKARGEKDAVPFSPGGFFLEIKFNDPHQRETVVDEEMKNKVITADCALGVVTIQFDEYGMLKSLDIS